MIMTFSRPPRSRENLKDIVSRCQLILNVSHKNCSAILSSVNVKKRFIVMCCSAGRLRGVASLQTNTSCLTNATEILATREIPEADEKIFGAIAELPQADAGSQDEESNARSATQNSGRSGNKTYMQLNT